MAEVYFVLYKQKMLKYGGSLLCTVQEDISNQILLRGTNRRGKESGISFKTISNLLNFILFQLIAD